MAKIMEIIEKETRGKSYHTYKYSYDSIGLPSIDYDDDPNKIIKWKDSGETGSPKNSINLKQLADQLQEVGEPSLFKYFLDGSRHVFKVDDIAYNKQVFPVVAGQIGIGCCKRDNKRMQKERFYRELVLALPDKANADGWDDAAYFASKVVKLNQSDELKRLNLHFSAILPYSTSKVKVLVSCLPLARCSLVGSAASLYQTGDGFFDCFSIPPARSFTYLSFHMLTRKRRDFREKNPRKSPLIFFITHPKNAVSTA